MKSVKAFIFSKPNMMKAFKREIFNLFLSQPVITPALKEPQPAPLTLKS